MGTFMEDDAMKLMEEMTRFEAEIATTPGVVPQPRHIIGANTFDLMQKKLETVGKGVEVDPLVLGADGLPVPLSVPPPSAPPGFGGIIPHVPTLAGIPPPPPPPSFMISQIAAAKGAPIPSMARVSPPPPVIGNLNFRPRPVLVRPTIKPQQVVVSAAPTKYEKSEIIRSNLDEELSNFLCEIRKEEEEQERIRKVKSNAKLMADSVRASTTISIQPISGGLGKMKKDKKNKKLIRMAGGQTWEDPSLAEWEDDDFRIFCGDLGNDVTDEVLTRAFNKYTSFLKAKVIRDKRTNKTKGFGFVSFKDPQDFIKAMKEMNGRYVGSRPIKLRKSTWKARNMEAVRKKEKEKAILINLLTGK